MNAPLMPEGGGGGVRGFQMTGALLCLDKVCRSVGYCTARPMKVILRVIFIHEFMG